jgi:hypothetical protein
MAPIAKHYKGHGDEVMASMKKTYKDEDTAKRVFYATENKREGKKSSRKRSDK